MQIIQNRVIDSFSKYKNSIAIVDRNRSITYRELEVECSNLYSLLSAKIKGKQFPRIALMFHSRINYIIGIIATLLVRGVFVPIDLSRPKNTVEYILDESDINIVIYENIDTLNKLNVNVEAVLYKYRQSNHDNSINQLVKNKSINVISYNKNDPIYLYYTSGTTGNPKGIIGRNSSLCHFIDWEIKTFNIDNTIRVSQLTSPAFDPFLRDIFVPLFAGGTICLFTDYENAINLRFCVDWIENYNINLIHCVPTLFQIIVNNFKKDKHTLASLKYIFLAGETINICDIRKWYEFSLENILLINLYGPTETTLAKLFHIISYEDLITGIIPLGKPISNTNVYLLNNNDYNSNNGEICIETEYSSLGYLNEKYNKERFIPNPFHNNKIFYKTGDYGYKNNRNEIIFSGRKDRQIKISGIGINLYNIENYIMQFSLAEQCLVIFEKKTNRMVCYYTSKADIDTKILKNKLKEVIPQIFIPQKYTRVKRLKTTQNGKIDLYQF